jgi:hypothetical protein
MSRSGTIKYLFAAATCVVAVCSMPVRVSGETPHGVTTSEEQLYSLLSEANSTFQQANTVTDSRDRAKDLYAKAILLYEKIIDQGGIRNAMLYYNLGNACYLNDDLGRAILNYRRAERLDASDVDLRNNLAFARNRRLDKVNVETGRRVLETLFFWHYDFPIKTRFWLAGFFFALLCIAGTLRVWLGRSSTTSAAAVLLGVLLLCFAVSVVVEVRNRAGTTYGVITVAEIVARQGDGPNYAPSFKDPLHAGTEFTLVEQRPGWFRIRLSDDSDAWIPDTSASLV